ncbi:2-polyprenyl-3-methyl-6-methoxy-1,4-benzoquinone monooxygenase [Alloalcanivorax gelatiniphagus]|uniref:3-demethoxyubiquinol 3-hydroxylase n=1 Tax=Alloalcanivorax gelatiniphagus TaxID=1194167 RepID=A0ABY2XK93_9GAMM|nr:2-polyprenyl-3-methyl-6-methoxy-1,4-benzoquinone monooxygenase [Alloalcanivorax gelatiniphagus]TMW12049.1 2-polyprenyl-3-methyl-6-methoxy-1,4-benzoquinone monooxygenase [Alloalcanivorax gelatiniphagus]|tara:strand:- start:339 stop:989 length:651 start_codon:yes stop_codon:yes gene_type:complete
MTERQLTPLDRLLSRVDNAMRTLTPGSAHAERQPQGLQEARDEGPLSDDERRHVTGLMRINHTGEVCAQGLYQGQASTATLPHVRHAMEEAAREEEDHLAWCEDRIRELGGVPSRLNPIFYAMSYALGAGAGLAGDRWSLGFVAETENQVVRHLENHMTRLPMRDRRSRAILEQMRSDELKHAVTASDAGGAPLPPPVRGAMTLMSKVMTFATYRV